jgi:hypothetical protein
MTVTSHRPRRLALLLSVSALALGSTLISSPAWSADRDRDGDGMPNHWESRHGLNPDQANGRGDKDHDGLTNIAEFRHHSDPSDEDTDADGEDDGDEVHDGVRGTSVTDDDTDDDGVVDGDEDSDHDGTDNEDEDDATETCGRDDDDSDTDGVSDEDENDHGTSASDDDSDDDGVLDGDEDSDHDGQSDEDDDDSLEDSCSDDSEDSDDLLGPIVSFDDVTGDLVIDTLVSGQLTFVVTADTDIEFDSSGHGSGADGDTSDLVAGAIVNEVDLADDGTLEDIELAQP